MSQPTRILHLITGLNQGGAETWLLRLLQGLGQPPFAGRFEHRVVSLIPEGVLAAPIRELGVPVQSLGMTRGLPGPGALLELAGILRQYRPQVLQTWLYHADLLGFCARALAGIAGGGGPGRPALSWGIRCAYMDFSRYGLSTRLAVRACAALSGRVEAVTANSRAGAEHHVRALGYSPATMRVLQNGVDAGRFRPDAGAREQLRREWGLGEGEVLLGLVARVDPMKGHELFCRMAARLKERHPGLRLVFCGAGTQADARGAELQAMLEGHGLMDISLRLGQRPDVERVCAALDVFVLPSLGEGFPNALAEAVACGVPAVALGVGDAAEILGPGGAVVPLRPVPLRGEEALAEALAAALAAEVGRLLDVGPAERARLGGLGRAHVLAQHSLAAAVARWAGHFEALAALPMPQ